MLLRARLLVRFSGGASFWEQVHDTSNLEQNLEQVQDKDLQHQAQQHAPEVGESHGSLKEAIEQHEMKLRKTASSSEFNSSKTNCERRLVRC